MCLAHEAQRLAAIRDRRHSFEHAPVPHHSVPQAGSGHHDHARGSHRLRTRAVRVLRLLWVAAARVAQMQVGLRQLPADQQELRGSLMNGYNFTERVRKVLAMAREEAHGLKHEYVGTEHMLLSLVREGEGVACTVFQNLNIEPEAMRSKILDVVKHGRAGPTPGPDLPYTSRAKKVLELAMTEARDLNHKYVGTEHLLLGLLREEKGIAAQVLGDAGLTLEEAREETLRILGTDTSTREIESRRSFVQGTHALIGRKAAAAEHLPKSARRLREIIGSAHDVAVERQSPIIAPTHLAIALLRHEGGMLNAVPVLPNFDRPAVLSALNEVAPRGTTPVDPEGVVTPAPEVVVAIEAMEELRRESNAATAGSHHLLLALIMTAPDVDSAFAGQHVDVNMIRESVRWLSG